MPQLQSILSHAVDAGFIAVGLAAAVDWARHRDRGHARLGGSLGLLAASALLSELNGAGYESSVLRLLAGLAFLGSGASLLSLRGLFIPLAPRAAVALALVIAATAAFDVAATVLIPPDSIGGPALQATASLAAVGLWIGFVCEASVRFWKAARGRPAVQRARLRALSFGFLTMVVAVLVAALVTGTLGDSGSPAAVVIDCIALLAIPSLYISLAPPYWLRRLWRQREERAFGRANDALMLFAPDRPTLARRGLEWAMRLVGAEAGALVDSDGVALALQGVDLAELAELRNGSAERAHSWWQRPRPRRHVTSLSLPVGDGPVALTVIAGAFSPLFGSDERSRLEQYAGSIALALDRVRLSEEVVNRSAELEAVVDAINDMGEGLLVRRNGRVIYANDAYRLITGYSAGDVGRVLSVDTSHASDANDGARRETEVVTADGARIHVEMAERTLSSSGGTLSVAMVRDITDRKQAERALAHQARLLDFTHDAILVRSLGPRSVITYWSQGAEKAYGWRGEDVAARNPHEVLNTVFPKPVAEIEAETVSAGQWEGELLLQRRDGTMCIVASRWALTLDDQGNPEGILEVNRDVTDRHRTEAMKAVQLAVGRALGQSETMDAAALAILGALGTNLDWQVTEMWLMDPTEESLTLRHWWHAPGLDAAVFEQAARRLALHRGQDLAGMVWDSVKPEFIADVVSDAGCQRRGLAAVLGLHGAAAFPVTVDGRVLGAVTMYAHRTRLLDDDTAHQLADLGRQMGAFLERRRTESALEQTVERLEQLAATDPLTGLYNRRAFERALSSVPAEPFAVLAVDVDNLKPLNDEYGHEAGDVILQAVAVALASIVRDRDVVARVGGDEFAILLTGAKGPEAASVAERMRSAMHAISVPYGQARISVGWTAAPFGADARAVWRATDELLYQAKSSGRDCVAGEDFQDRVRPGGAGPSDAELLSTVLADQQISAVFQPIINLQTGAVTGYEALARPSGLEATASVEALFAAARRLGRIRDLDWLCRRTAVRAAKTLPGEPTLFLNVSAVAFLDPVHPVDQLLLLLTWAGWPPERTVLEITEQEAVRDLARVRFVVAAYREHGLRFAIDDVGEGHSTLELLAATNPEFVKIAGKLTASIADSGHFSAVQAALAFARSSRAQVIAEGIETEEMAASVRELGIELGQGYGLGLPAPAAEHAARHRKQARPAR